MGKWILGILGPIMTGVAIYWLTIGSNDPQHPANITIATPVDSDFKLNFIYRDSAGGPLKPLLPGSVLRSGDQYKVVFTPHRTGYIYLFQVDSHDQIFQLFPMTEFRGIRLTNTNPVQAGRQYTVPAPDKSFRLDNAVGLERILLVFTDGPNEELASLAKTLTDARSRNDTSTQSQANIALSSKLNTAFQYRGLDSVETDHFLTSKWFSSGIDIARFGATAAWNGDELLITGLEPRQDPSNTGSHHRRIIKISMIDQKVVKTLDMDVVSSGSGDDSACGAAFSVLPSSEYAVDCKTIWSAQDGTRIASFFPLTNGEWMIMTPEGYYNSSANAHEYVKMRMGNSVYGAEQLYDVFFRPELVIKRLRGEDISRGENIPSIQDALAEPPPVVQSISIYGPTNKRVREVHFTVKGSGGGIGDISVLHNDKETRHMVANMGGAADFSDSVTVEGAPGLNQVTVRPKNRSNTVRGIMRSERFTVEGIQTIPQVYVLSIGVGRYVSERDSLPHAATDAKRVADSFQRALATLYPKDQIHVEIVANEEATRDGLWRG